MSYQQLQTIDLQGGINPSAARLSPESMESLSDGSWNNIVSGDGFTRPFRGFTSQGANTGSRKMMPIGKTWGGIKDIGGTLGAGSFIQDIGKSRWGIGAGQPHIEGTDVAGFVLSTNLQVSIASGGTYAAPVNAGLSQPSAPEIGIIQLPGDISNSMSAKIERRRPSTGARSVASPTSAVAVPQANRLRLTFPAASTGQTHWRAYFTFQGFGGTGVHYLASYNGSSDIPEATVAAGTVDGIARSLEFNFKDGDLIPIEASYDDYAPPAATHLLRLENVMNLAGCYADSSSSPTSTNTGVAIAVSKQNNYESYIPTHLLYLPEQIVDSLARPIDDYGYIGCENGIFAIQYIGDRGDELPPCTITTILPDIGIEYAHNWCHFRGRLLIYTAEGNLLLMDENGNFDTDFAGPVTKLLKSFTTAATSVGYDPRNDSIVVNNGKRQLVFSLQRRVWRQIWIPDFAVTGTTLSCVTAKRALYVTVTNGGSNTAYSYDTAVGVFAPISVVSNYQNAPGGNAVVKDIYEMAVAAESSDYTGFLYACITKNLAKGTFRRVSTTLGSAVIGNTSDPFYAAMLNKRVLLFGTSVSGGNNYFHGRVSAYTNTGSVTLADLAGTPLSAGATLTELLMFVGDYTAVTPFAKEHVPNLFPYLSEVRSYQVSLALYGSNDVGNVLTCDVFGDAYASSRAL